MGFAACYAAFYLVVLPLLRHHSDQLAPLHNFHLLSLPFVIGMALFKFRHQAPLRPSIVGLLFVLSALSHAKPWFQELFVFSWSYAIFYVGFLKFRPLLAYNQLGDYSYGMYIYAFPVEQIVAHLYKSSTPGMMMTLSLPITLLLAVLSWHCIEQRALKQKGIVSAWLRKNMRLPYMSSATKSLDS
jgi:peptidoglycan/LPS O-acetylase OafA/YrhL